MAPKILKDHCIELESHRAGNFLSGLLTHRFNILRFASENSTALGKHKVTLRPEWFRTDPRPPILYEGLLIISAGLMGALDILDSFCLLDRDCCSIVNNRSDSGQAFSYKSTSTARDSATNSGSSSVFSRGRTQLERDVYVKRGCAISLVD